MTRQVDFHRICTQLNQTLNRILEYDASCQPAKNSIDILIQQKYLNENEASQVWNNIINLHGIKSLNYKNKTLAINMIQLMVWWLIEKPSEIKSDLLINLLCQENSDDQTTVGIHILFSLFNIPQCNEKQIDDLINLIFQCLHLNRNRLNEFLHLNPEVFRPIWKIYFDSDESIQSRETLNKIIDLYLMSVQSTDELILVLGSIDLNDVPVKHCLHKWSLLFGNLAKRNFLDIEVVKLLFEQLDILNVNNHENDLNKLILNLLEHWPKLTQDDQQLFIIDRLINFIQKIFSKRTDQSVHLVEDLAKRICAKTSANDHHAGNDSYLILIDKFLSIFEQLEIFSAMTIIDDDIIEWYAEFFLKQQNNLITDQCSTFINILKQIVKITKKNYLKIFFNFTKKYPNKEFLYEIIVNSIYPSTTVLKFVQEISADEIHRLISNLINVINSKFIDRLLIIIEILSENIPTHLILFQSNRFDELLMKWLLNDDSFSTNIRLIRLLLEFGTKYASHHNDISDFLLEKYSTKMFRIDFKDQSPFVEILLFLSNDIQETIYSKRRNEILLERFFYSVEDEYSDAYASHLFNLSQNLLDLNLRIKLTDLLLPYIPEFFGFLDQSESIKEEALKILTFLMNFTEIERTSLLETMHIKLNHDEPKASVDTIQTTTKDIDHRLKSFFTSEQVQYRNCEPVRATHFAAVREFLVNLKEGEFDRLFRERIATEKDNTEIIPNQLVSTPTTIENVLKICELTYNPIPILLEGGTGVGKSAVVMEAARRCNNQKLIRYSMSSRVTIDDLLGKTMLSYDQEQKIDRFKFLPGPFTSAFINGDWILLDELNLAQDTVLQAIESALDTQQLKIYNNGSAEESILNYQMNPNFRLFATQNPNSGFFKGKREPSSSSFLSRFRLLIFKSLSLNEWYQIALERFHMNPIEAEKYGVFLVKRFLKNLETTMNDPSKNELIERGPYVTNSIRELLKWIDHLNWQRENESWPTNDHECLSMLSFNAWCIYGARCRTIGRQLIINILTDYQRGGWGNPLNENPSIRIGLKQQKIYFDHISCPVQIQSSLLQNSHDQWTSIFRETIPFNQSIWSLALEIHITVYKALMDEDFIRLHGIYCIDQSWLYHWLHSASTFLNETDQFLCHGYKQYVARLRHQKAYETVRNCFQIHVKNIDLAKTSIDSSSIQVGMPFILTKRVLRTFKEVAFHANIHQPILLTGPEGCGKSDLLLTLAWLHGQQINQLNITTETEPSLFIGQMTPNDMKNSNEKLIWKDGYVTQSYVKGHWILLDNFNSAEASVIERLNPILEDKPMLILTEKGDDKELTMHCNYRLLATVTTPHFSTTSSMKFDELSPSLYSRFAVVHMLDFDSKSDELDLLANGLLSDEDENLSKFAVEIIRQICEFSSKNMSAIPHLTLRTIIRFLDSVCRLYQRFKSTMDSLSILWNAYQITIANQLKGEQMKNILSNQIEEILKRHRNLSTFSKLPWSSWIPRNSEHILTSSRENYALAILGAVLCNIPVLLEGPSAVGKTSLIHHLCQYVDYKTMFNRDCVSSIKLERVNNSETTTIQDYLGTYLPVNDGFLFQKGALYRAMENGWWFLADEFNLADPSVMSVLFPLLEGKNSIVIPSTGEVIYAKVGFQFFATQNDSSYLNRHQLPNSLRNRFLEIQFDDFPKNELCEILHKRKRTCERNLNEDDSNRLADFYHRLINTQARLTFRELIKWIHRDELFSSKNDLSPLTGLSLLIAKYPLQSNSRQQIIEQLKDIWKTKESLLNPKFEIKQIGGNILRFQENNLSMDIETIPFEQSIVSLSPECFKQSLIRLALAVNAGEPVLLIGPNSYKSLLVDTWVKLINRSDDFIKVHLTNDTETNDLIGEIQPYNCIDLLKRLGNIVQNFIQRFRSLCSNERDENIEGTCLKQLTLLVNKDLVEAIRNFENLSNISNEQYQEKDFKFNNFNQLHEQTEKYLWPSIKKSNEQVFDDDDYQYDDDAYDQVESDTTETVLETTMDVSHSSISIEEDQSIVRTPSDIFINQYSFNKHKLTRELYEIIKKIYHLIDGNDVLKRFCSIDPTLSDYRSKLNELYQSLSHENLDLRKPYFLFNDGPVTKAAKQSGILFFEDLDLPNQTVIERLNSMFETNRTFTLTEDITTSGTDRQLEIKLTKHFQIFASVHQDDFHQQIKLSAATRSRFTQIYISPYNEDDLKDLVKIHLNQQTKSSEEINLMFSLRTKIHCEMENKLSNDVHLLFRWIDFINQHKKDVTLMEKILIGARFIYFDLLPMDRQLTVFDDWLQSQNKTQEFGCYRRFFQQFPIMNQNVFKLTEGQLVLDTFDLRIPCDENQHEFNQRLKKFEENFVATSTSINQIARIFTAVSCRTPLLLEGPPGVGKTQIILQIASLIGMKCERISLSGNTTLDQLIGCYVPRFVKNVRVFQWQQGRLISAIREKRWILLDELNLVSPEVLQGLAPLFYRSTKYFHIRMTDERICLDNIQIFATMNPSNINNGRHRLARSIQNLFALVQVDDYHEEEIQMILHRWFANVQINNEQINALFQLHLSFKLQLSQGVLSRTRASYNVNLRDLAKFRDVFCSLINSQLFHEDAQMISSVDKNFLILHSLRKSAQIVYANQYQDENDFQHASNMINEIFPISIEFQENARFIETSSSSTFIRIGSICMKKGSHFQSTFTSELIHTKRTIEQLELLAAVCQSKRTILLEGDVCSGKTSLVIELARLTQNKLVLIPLHENFQSSDLIGSLLPSIFDKNQHPEFVKIDELFHEIEKFILMNILPILSNIYIDFQPFSLLKSILQLRKSISKGNLKEFCAFQIESLKQMIDLLKKFNQIEEQKVKTFVTHYQKKLVDAMEILENIQTNLTTEMAFTFVESELIQAMTYGSWVLLDNLNSASIDVLERLNSLTEEDSFLYLHEHPDQRIFKRSDGTIHENFRLFTTANFNRIYSNKLSEAFLTRVIRFSLPQIDQTDQLEHLVKTQLADLSGGHEFAQVFVTMHRYVKENVVKQQLIYPNHFQVTYRLLQQCLQTFKSFLKTNLSSVDACVYSLFRSYCSSLSNDEQHRTFLRQLDEVIVSLNLHLSSTIFSAPVSFNNNRDEQILQLKMISLERFMMTLPINVIEFLPSDQIRNVLLFILDEILLHIFPNNVELIEAKNRLVNEDQTELILEIVKRSIQIENIEKQLTLEIFIENVLKSLQIYVENISIALEDYILNCSYTDVQQRRCFIQRILSVIEIFSQFFNYLTFSKRFRGISSCFQSLVAFRDQLNPLKILIEPSFIEFRSKYWETITKDLTININLLCVFEELQSKPIRFVDKQIRRLIEGFLLSNTCSSTSRDLLQKYLIILEFIRIHWTFKDYLNKSIRQSLQENVSITEQFLLECDLKYASLDLHRQIDKLIEQTVRKLPAEVESDQINDDFLRIKQQLENERKQFEDLQNEIDEIQRRLKKSNDEEISPFLDFITPNVAILQPFGENLQSKDHEIQSQLCLKQKDLEKLSQQIQRSTQQFNEIKEKYKKYLDKASEARNVFRSSLENILQLSSFDKLRLNYEKSNTEQLNQLCECFHRYHSKLKFTTKDFPIDFNSLINTTNIKQLLGNEQIRRSPLFFFISTFYCLPQFSHEISIRIFSNWNQLIEQNIDINSFNANLELFFCPNQNPNDCARLKFLREDQQFTVNIFSLNRQFPLDELQNYFENLLPLNIDLYIEQMNSFNNQNLLSNDHPDLFSFCCLLQIMNEIHQSEQDKLYEQGLNIIQRLIDKNPLRTRISPAITYHQVCSLRNQAELYYRNEINEMNQWSICVLQLWNLLKPFQIEFSSSTCQTIEDDLHNTIKSLKIQTLNARLVSLAFLETQSNSFVSKHLIANSLTIDKHPITKQSIDEYSFLLNAIQKSQLLMKLIIEFVINNDKLDLEKIYQKMIDFVDYLQKIFHSIFSVIDMKNVVLHISQHYSKEQLNEFQKIINEFLSNIDFPSMLIRKHNLENFISNLWPMFDIQRKPLTLINTHSIIRRSSSFESLLCRREMIEKTIEEIRCNLIDILSRINQLPLKPHELIRQIHSTIYELKSFNIDQNNDNHLKIFRNKEKQIIQSYELYRIEIKNYKSLQIYLPFDRPISNLNEQQIRITHPIEIDLTKNFEEFERIQENIFQRSHCKTLFDVDQLPRLVHTSIINQLWLHTLSLFNKENYEEFKSSLMLLNDDLTIKYNCQSNEKFFFNEIIRIYSQHRCQLLINEWKQKESLSNYRLVADFIRTFKHWPRNLHVNMFNLLDHIQMFNDIFNNTRNRLKNYTTEMICDLLPIEIRPEDLICFFAPQYTTIINELIKKLEQIDEKLSCKIDEIEPISLTFLDPSTDEKSHGLVSFFYYDQHSRKIPLFDERKHIHYIIDRTCQYLQQLINTIIDNNSQKSNLLSIATSYKQLFPLQISLSCAFLIISDWSAMCLEDSPTFVEHLVLRKFDEIQNQIKQMETNLKQMTNQLTKSSIELEEKEKYRKEIEKELKHRSNCEFIVQQRLEQDYNVTNNKCQIMHSEHQRQRENVEFLQNQLKDFRLSAQQQMKNEQIQWFDRFKQSFNQISHLIRRFIIPQNHHDMCEQIPNHDECLTALVDFFNHDLFQSIEDKRFNNDEIYQLNEQQIESFMKDLRELANELQESDTMFSFLHFYFNVISMSLCSLKNSIFNWKNYLKTIQSSEIESFISNGTKEILCQLKSSLITKSFQFIHLVRNAHEYDEVKRSAEEIYKTLRCQTDRIINHLISQRLSEQVQNLFNDFNQFIINLLLIGCKYSQKQFQIEHTLDDLLIGFTFETIDLKSLNKEIDLLQLLDDYEIQIKSHMNSLSNIILHLTFDFNSSLYSNFEELNQLNLSFIELVVPTAFMIEKTWSTILTLFHQIKFHLFTDEFSLFLSIAKEFEKFVHSSYETKNQFIFLDSKFDIQCFEQISNFLNTLCDLLIRRRANIHSFCNEMKERWNLTCRELFQGFIKVKLIVLNRNIEKYRRIEKDFHSQTNRETMKLAAIDPILVKRKDLQ
ncbi:unnamed protein product, partial [Adineta ricciae]